MNRNILFAVSFLFLSIFLWRFLWFWPLAGIVLSAFILRADREVKISADIALFFLWIVVSVLFSGEPINSFAHIWHYLCAFVFYIFARNLSADNKELFVKPLIVLGFLALFLRAFFPALGGLFGRNLNYSACIGLTGLCGAFALFFKPKYPRRNLIILSVFFAFGIIALFLTGSRGAFLALLAVIVFILFGQGYQKTAAGIIIGLLLAVVLIPSDILSSLLKGGQFASFARIEIWQTSFKMFFADPLSGTGIGCYERGFMPFNFPFFNGISFYGQSAMAAENSVLNFACETGIIGGALFLFIVLIRLFRKTQTDGEKKIWAMFCGIFLFSLVEDVLLSTAVIASFFALAGLVKTEKLEFAVKKSVVVLIMCIIAASALTNAYIIRQKDKFEKGASEDGTKILTIYPQDSLVYAKLGIRALSSVPSNPARSLELFETAALLEPKNALYPYYMARVNDNAGNFAQAEIYFARALSLEPNFISAAIELGYTQLKLGRKDLAKKTAQHARETAERMKDIIPSANYERILTKYAPASLADLEKAVSAK